MPVIPFTRAPSQLVPHDDMAVLEPKDGVGSLEPAPKLPPVQLLSPRQSFSDLFRSPPQSPDAKGDKSMTSGFPSKEAPLGKSGQTRIVSTVRTKAVQDAEFAAHAQSRIHVLGPTTMATKPGSLKYTSSGSSTHRSKTSSNSPKPSRPSSRSSVAESLLLRNVVPKKVNSDFSLSPNLTVDETNSSNRSSTRIEQSPNLSIETPRGFFAASAPNKNKPLPPEPPVEVESALSPLRWKHSTTTIQLSTPEPEHNKRGARLGKKMVETLKPSRQSRIFGLKVAMRSSHTIDTINSNAGEKQPQKLPKVSSRVKSIYQVRAFPLPEQILFRAMSFFDNLSDLQSVALVCQSFYRTFRRYEKDLVSRILFQVSVPAWELRQIMRCEQKRSAFRLRSVQRDMSTVRALQAFIVMKCGSTCRKSTIDSLSGGSSQRQVELSNAIWRVWIFCKLFGKSRGQEDTFSKQLVWLDGGERKHKDDKTIALGIGNGKGLSIQELEDISEVWKCFKNLLDGFRGREDEARRAGIFDHCIIDAEQSATESGLLNSWIYNVMSLGPKAVLTLVSCSFEQAKVLGLTNWTPPEPGQNRSSFLKAAVEHVYRERLVSDARTKALEFEQLMRSQTIKKSVTNSPKTESAPKKVIPAPLLIKTTLLEVQEPPANTPNHISDPEAVLPDRARLSPSQQAFSQDSPVVNTSSYSSIAMTPGTSARFGATLFPMQYPKTVPKDDKLQSNTNRASIVTTHSPEISQVIDPIDQAMAYLTKEKGYPEAQVKRALAMSDSGTGIDVDQAARLLASGLDDNAHTQIGRMNEMSTVPENSAFGRGPGYYRQPVYQAYAIPPRNPLRLSTRYSPIATSDYATMGTFLDDNRGIRSSQYQWPTQMVNYPTTATEGLSHSHSVHMAAGHSTFAQRFRFGNRPHNTVGGHPNAEGYNQQNISYQAPPKNSTQNPPPVSYSTTKLARLGLGMSSSGSQNNPAKTKKPTRGWSFRRN